MSGASIPYFGPGPASAQALVPQGKSEPCWIRTNDPLLKRPFATLLDDLAPTRISLH